jgi:uncharacterized protein (TIGR02444 family)
MAEAGGNENRGSPFWRFSLGYYRKRGVADACIALQDEYGVDVNLLLFLLWLASIERRLTPDELGTIAEEVRGWQAGVIAPLRDLRRKLKHEAPLVEPGSAELFRTKIKGLELEAERLQQQAMYELWGRAPLGEPAGSVIEAARANIAALQNRMGRGFPIPAVEVLVTALQEG